MNVKLHRKEKIHTDLLIVGAGPAGLAAALAAASATEKPGLQIDIVDDNISSGGQIWRGGAHEQKDARARDCWNSLINLSNVRFHFQSKVVHSRSSPTGSTVLLENRNGAQEFHAKKMILATGARELFLPFPGWTLPGVSGAGGLQALAKNAYPVQGKRIVVAGTGPLLMAVAASLIERGAVVTHILEQSTHLNLAQFALSLLATPSKISQGIKLGLTLRKIHYHANSYVLSAHGTQKLQHIRAHINGRVQEIACDFLACGYHLIPNTELAAGMGCALDESSNHPRVEVNQWQETSLEHVYCAGEGTGVGGVDLALVEGEIAGLAATGQIKQAQALFNRRSHWKKFSARLEKYFHLRGELRHLSQADTLVCRCEDVRYDQLQDQSDWRSAKLHTRCGMGACQGRICGAACSHLFAWTKDAARLPFSATRIASLLEDTHTDSV